MKTLVAKGLTKTFPLNAKQRRERKDGSKAVVAVNDVDLNLESGEIYGLLGPNGAGKTTTLRMIATLIKPDSGKILFDGKDIRDDIIGYKKKIGFLTSELKLDDFFSPDYTFTYMSRLYGTDENKIQERKEKLFRQFGILDFKDTKIHDLSTGMKQKASLAVSLAHDPEVIIFDEPTNGLDIIAAKEVEDYLVNLKKEGKIILVSTHIFSLVEKLCDRVGILLNGKMAIEGKLSSLTKERDLETLFFDLYHGGKAA
ncbi:MAG TPA: ABC transporter ATP-binding protein [Candidatus Enterosoma merdigallinarum]|nr:ABC transporter ATP-binding protein [Candidatus Enterosoma merdigallinarum]